MHAVGAPNTFTRFSATSRPVSFNLPRNTVIEAAGKGKALSAAASSNLVTGGLQASAYPFRPGRCH
jgi:hypothetical protein